MFDDVKDNRAAKKNQNKVTDENNDSEDELPQKNKPS